MKILAFYFSGTGNTQFACQELQKQLYPQPFSLHSIEEKRNFIPEFTQHDTILIAYPIYAGVIPPIMRKFLQQYRPQFKNKQLITLVTQHFFSGDGGALVAKELKHPKTQLKTIATIHLNMPTNLEFRPLIKIKNGTQVVASLAKTKKKIKQIAIKIQTGKPIREGRQFYSFFIGYFFQRAYFKPLEKWVISRLRIDQTQCILCKKCIPLSPTQNLKLEIQPEKKIIPQGKCTLCYRCIHSCPTQAIRLLSRKTIKVQYLGPTHE